jgi:hypothetical protein
MTHHRDRYPGAQPFGDDEVSRKVFFGRDLASRTLADKILAQRVVVVYARSGLGKTSLLKAGVAPLLREEGFLPLFVRVNDVRHGPLHSLYEAIPSEAERQQAEYVAGRQDSLWSFFKTAEFWLKDLLLTPVLIVDQFEELFTLQDEQARGEFLDQLGFLVRGVAPPGAGVSSSERLDAHAPLIRVVLCLREDYLGLLEEAADHIPEILDVRFRLAPLDVNAAEQAIVGPARVDAPDFATRPFTLDRDAVSSVLNFLSQRRAITAADARRYVDSFQLQLVCRRIEQVAAARQAGSTSGLTITMKDIGGEAVLLDTLGDFYRDAVRALPDRRQRRLARRLCERHLISPEGRRLSLEEGEIRRELGLPQDTLRRLVESRVLRSDSRAESTYYELSHDALVRPIVDTRAAEGMILGWSGLVSSIVVLVLSLLAFLVTTVASIAAIVELLRKPEEMPSPAVMDMLGIAFFLVLSLGLMVAAFAWMRASAQLLLRHGGARKTAVSDVAHDYEQRGGAIRGALAICLGLSVIVVGASSIAACAVIAAAAFSEQIHSIAKLLDVSKYVSEHGIGIDWLASVVASAALVVTGAHVFRWGLHRVARYPGRRRLWSPWRPYAAYPTRATWRSIGDLLGGATLLACAALSTGFLLLVLDCGFPSPGQAPQWLDKAWFHMVYVDCRDGFEDLATGLVGLFFGVLLIGASLLIGIAWLRRGLAAVRRPLDKSRQMPTMAPDMG